MSIPNERKIYQTLQKEIPVGKYYAIVRTSKDYTGPDMFYQFVLTYK